MCACHFKVAYRFNPLIFFHHSSPKNENFLLYSITIINIRKLISISHYHLISSSYSNFPNYFKICFVTGFVNYHSDDVQKLHCLCILTLVYAKIAPSSSVSNKICVCVCVYISQHCFFKEIRPVAFYIILHSGLV